MFQYITKDALVCERNSHYHEVSARIFALIDNEDDWISAMATVVCELHNSFEYFHWTGFYRSVAPELLKIGPYQGGHGCLQIPYSKGVCGLAARSQVTQKVDNVNAIADHIACSATTQSELVVPIVGADGSTKAVLDIDSDDKAVFTDVDAEQIEEICKRLALRFFG